MKSKLLKYLQDLEGVPNTKEGNEHYHPEGDALVHTLQVATLAYKHYPNKPNLLQAALLHDIGKAVQPLGHANIGAKMLREALPKITAKNLGGEENPLYPATIYLVENHSQLMYWEEISIGKFERMMQDEWISDLWRLRKLDLSGRKKGMKTMSLEELFDKIIVNYININ